MKREIVIEAPLCGSMSGQCPFLLSGDERPLYTCLDPDGGCRNLRMVKSADENDGEAKRHRACLARWPGAIKVTVEAGDVPRPATEVRP